MRMSLIHLLVHPAGASFGCSERECSSQSRTRLKISPVEKSNCGGGGGYLEKTPSKTKDGEASFFLPNSSLLQMPRAPTLLKLVFTKLTWGSALEQSSDLEFLCIYSKINAISNTKVVGESHSHTWMVKVTKWGNSQTMQGHYLFRYVVM